MANPRRLRLFWSITAMVVMIQLIVVQAMAASASLHEHCHDHAHEPEHHECAVTLMLQGGYDKVTPDIVPVDCHPEPPLVVVDLPAAILTESAHFIGGVLAHAPPRGP